ncbi:DUF4294 domain-containing protein [Segetibacter aerophilus]|uniref:DUF4294 domain-containing protein n=1 Tax=Segetibacter aerophilus TaxID=670293 RepID=A0A512BDL7_9BACT|nr:DUF4294 domain-containing protein [Segetibacter aerophilus]GEO10061.1 hypothetical protein SAE01_25570 [Segetibacter aerophilus]
MSKNYKLLLTGGLIVFLLLSGIGVNAQDNRNDTLKVYAFVVDGDTIPGGRLLDVEVYTKMHAKWRQYWAEWNRLRNAVYVTYPYAKAAGKVFNEVNSLLVNVTDKQERKRIIKSREKELKKEFTSKITNLSVYQGKVLMKLIYRETGNNCYHLIQEYKGGFTAGFYQTVAIIFGSSLKQNYDPVEKDQAIEIIVKDVERMYGHRS